jgi:hypothetical protein
MADRHDRDDGSRPLRFLHHVPHLFPVIKRETLASQSNHVDVNITKASHREPSIRINQNVNATTAVSSTPPAPDYELHTWIAKDGSPLTLIAGSYHVQYIVLNDGKGMKTAYGTIVTDDRGTEVMIELQAFDAENRAHTNYRLYAEWRGESDPW